MSDSSNKFVIFLAFANDCDNAIRYLRNLPDEARRLREVMEPAEKAGLWSVVMHFTRPDPLVWLRPVIALVVFPPTGLVRAHFV
jgi:hypothetical protein